MMKYLALVDIGKKLPIAPGVAIESKYGSASVLIRLILQNAMTIAGILLLCLLVFGGVMYIVGAGEGDPKKAQIAQTAITDALIGFVIVFTAYFIIQIIQYVTGVPILNSTL
ncbi:MAG: hypothetical protein WC686_04250 [Candidatus Shapirobacteria bacterium]|jgi:hypothetical protein